MEIERLKRRLSGSKFEAKMIGGAGSIFKYELTSASNPTLKLSGLAADHF
jgi:hypothetical protein